MAQALVPVEFHGATLYAITINGTHFVALRPICDSLGIDWEAQRQRIKRNPVLAEGACVMKAPSSGGEQDTLALPLTMLNGWLFGVSVNRVKPELREKLIAYQRECFDVLARHFLPQTPYCVQPGQTLSAEQAEALRELLTSHVKRLPKEKQAGAMIKGWSKLKAHFKTDYRHIPASEYHEAVSILARHTAEWEVVDEDPAPKLSLDDTARLDMAFHLASNAAAQVQRAVFSTVMGDKGLGSMSSQWMLYFHQKSWGDKSSMDAYCKPLAIDAICLGPDAYLANLERGDGHILTSDQLARMAEFSIKKLASRMRQHASPVKAAV